MKTKNPILKHTAQLVKVIRESVQVEDQETLQEAISELKKFADSWLVNGKQENLDGAGDCCLSDTNTTEAIREALETWTQ